MGGRVKKSRGYNIDDFVGDSEEVEMLSSESEYEGRDGDSEASEVEVKKKASKKSVSEKPNGAAKTKARTLSKARSVTPEPPFLGRGIRAARKLKQSYSNDVDDDELVAVIGAGTDSDAAESDFSNFEAGDGLHAEVSDVSDGDRDVIKDKKDTAKQEALTSAPIKAEASPPGVERGREAMKEDDSDDYHRPSKIARDVKATHGPMSTLSALANAFGMTSRKGSNDEVSSIYANPDIAGENDGPYYV